jgi:hypothetical protein
MNDYNYIDFLREKGVGKYIMKHVNKIESLRE